MTSFPKQFDLISGPLMLIKHLWRGFFYLQVSIPSKAWNPWII